MEIQVQEKFSALPLQLCAYVCARPAIAASCMTNSKLQEQHRKVLVLVELHGANCPAAKANDADAGITESIA